MRTELENIQRIEQYLQNQLSSEDLSAFEQEMESSLEFKQEVELQKKLVQSIRQQGVLQAIGSEHERFERKEKINKMGKMGGILFGILVLIGTVFSLIHMSKNRSKNQAVTVIEEPIPAEVTTTPAPAAIPEGLLVPFNTYTFKAEKGKNIVDPRSGAKIKVARNIFVDKQGKDVIGEVELKYREFRDPADMAFSQIPMTTEEDGKNYWFTSGGMFEMSASQDGVPIYIRPKKEIKIDFKLTERLEGMNFYALDAAAQQWQKLHAIELPELPQPEEESVERSSDSTVNGDTVRNGYNFGINEQVQPNPGYDSFVMVEKEPAAINWNEVIGEIGFPNVAREAGIEGQEVVRILIEPDGIPSSYRVLKSTHPILQKAVTDQIADLRFTPGMNNGKPIQVWVTIPFDFILNEGGTIAKPKIKSEGMTGTESGVVKLREDSEVNRSLSEKGIPIIAAPVPSPDPESINKKLEQGKKLRESLKATDRIQLGISAFTIFNCDKPISVRKQAARDKQKLLKERGINALSVLPYYFTEPGDAMIFGSIVVCVDEKLNAAFSYPANRFICDQNSKTQLILFTNDGKLFYRKPHYYTAGRKDRESSYHRLTMIEITEEVEDIGDLRTILNKGVGAIQ